MIHLQPPATPTPQPLLHWEDVWPSTVQPGTAGWSAQLAPGLSAWLDPAGDDAHHWLSLLAGATPPARGRVQCGALCSQADRAAYQAQVYWHQPHQLLQDCEVLVDAWLQHVAQRWPTWDAAAWEAHCAGFGLAPHLGKPLWHLSTGSLRKLGMAAALASGAPLTLIEEPVAALDSRSIQYLCQALDALGETLASNPAAAPRWVIVAHWEPLPGVTWDEVLEPPALGLAQV